jgi:hypothetical protein
METADVSRSRAYHGCSRHPRFGGGVRAGGVLNMATLSAKQIAAGRYDHAAKMLNKVRERRQGALRIDRADRALERAGRRLLEARS